MEIPKLIYNAAAHFAATEKYPDGLATAVGETGRAGFDALCWALSELSTQAELIRRDMGYDKGDIHSPEYFRLRLKPIDVIPMKGAVLKAMTRGMSVGEENDEVDEILQEIEKKTEGEPG